MTETLAARRKRVCERNSGLMNLIRLEHAVALEAMLLELGFEERGENYVRSFPEGGAMVMTQQRFRELLGD